MRIELSGLGIRRQMNRRNPGIHKKLSVRGKIAVYGIAVSPLAKLDNWLNLSSLTSFTVLPVFSLAAKMWAGIPSCLLRERSALLLLISTNNRWTLLNSSMPLGTLFDFHRAHSCAAARTIADLGKVFYFSTNLSLAFLMKHKFLLLMRKL